MVTFGFILGEVVRRMTGRTLGQYLRDRDRRAARHRRAHRPAGARARPLRRHDRTSRTSATCWPPERRPSIRSRWPSTRGRPGRRDGVRPRRRTRLADDSAVGAQLEFPATNAHVSALGMATFYNALAQEKLLSAASRWNLCRESQGGFDTDVVLGPRVADHGWGLGYMLNQRGVAGPNPADIRPRRVRWLVCVRRPGTPHRLRVRDESVRRHEVQCRPAQRGALRRGLRRYGGRPRLSRGAPISGFAVGTLDAMNGVLLVLIIVVIAAIGLAVVSSREPRAAARPPRWPTLKPTPVASSSGSAARSST